MNSSKRKLDKTKTNQRVALATLPICYYHILKPSKNFTASDLAKAAVLALGLEASRFSSTATVLSL